MQAWLHQAGAVGRRRRWFEHMGVSAAQRMVGVCDGGSTSAPPAPHWRPALQSATAFADTVNAAGGKAELFIYEDAGHGFLNEGALGGSPAQPS